MRKSYTVVAAAAGIFFLLFPSGRLSAEQRTEEERYQVFRTELIELYNAKKYDEAADLIERNFDAFPGKEMNMAYNMALICKDLGDYKKGIEYLERAHEKGLWFSIYAFQGEFWEPYRDLEGFRKVMARNLEMKDEAQNKAKPKMEIILPENLEEGKTYPLFIALHGGGENIESFKPRWKSALMDREFIIAFLQSSQVSSMDGFAWEDQEITMKEIGEAFNKIREDYPVNLDEVIVGGFSSGGYASLVVAFLSELPVKGFIVLCPPMPDNITEADVLKGKEKGIRGTIITTELDRRVPDQRGMADLFKKIGLQYQFILTPNIGHWYPEDLPEMIDRAIEHIRSG